MGLFASENTLLYIVVTYVVYLFYLWMAPPIVDCSFCQDDGLFHKCRLGTGKTGEWCFDYTYAGQFGKTIAEHFGQTAIDVLALMAFIPKFIVEEAVHLVDKGMHELFDALSLSVLGDILNFDGWSCKICIVPEILCIDICKGISDIIEGFMKLIGLLIKGMVDLAALAFKAIGEMIQAMCKIVVDAIMGLFHALVSGLSVLTDGIGKIFSGLGQIFSKILGVKFMMALKSIAIVLLGIISTVIIVQFLILISGAMTICAIPIGGLIGAFKFVIYIMLTIVSYIYYFFDINLQESKLIRWFESII